MARTALSDGTLPGAMATNSGSPSGTRSSAAALQPPAEALTPRRLVDLERRFPPVGEPSTDDHDAGAVCRTLNVTLSVR